MRSRTAANTSLLTATSASWNTSRRARRARATPANSRPATLHYHELTTTTIVSQSIRRTIRAFESPQSGYFLGRPGSIWTARSGCKVLLISRFQVRVLGGSLKKYLQIVTNEKPWQQRRGFSTVVKFSAPTFSQHTANIHTMVVA